MSRGPDAEQRLAALTERCEGDPSAVAAIRTEGDGLATELGGDAALRWSVAVVRAIMAEPPDGDAVRELYGELVDRYRDDAPRLAILRPLGDEIRRREADGSLPSALVARTGRRPPRG